MTSVKAPVSLSEALYLAAELAKHNEELERELFELRSKEYPEVLRPAHMMKLLNVGKSTVSEMTNDPNFPILNSNRRKGEVILVLKSDLYHYLKYVRGKNAAS